MRGLGGHEQRIDASPVDGVGIGGADPYGDLRRGDARESAAWRPGPGATTRVPHVDLASQRVQAFDWSVVASQVLRVYETAIAADPRRVSEA